eukprot:CAMPEP_0184020078 /NCGR_PEP_ID=MMETSP0954-20121128/9144_1 /TAXON_ID=627963 /ORGANISM="Aplanochytrium sp, Strain PBS07" /LENGTH=683 /DNA_ID=CAMNT_0026301889 /DNA_START=211 /DNA_END=2259 /DNA_ORIENTATION=+
MSRYVEVYAGKEAVKNGAEKSHIIALHLGMDPEELQLMLKTLFCADDANATIVGLQAVEKNISLPLSVACKAPGVLTAPRYKLLISKSALPITDDDMDTLVEDEEMYENMRSIILEMFEEGKNLIRQKILAQDGEAYDEDEILYLKLKLQISILLELAINFEERIVGAFLAYEIDGNVEELKDTLRHLALIVQQEAERESNNLKDEQAAIDDHIEDDVTEGDDDDDGDEESLNSHTLVKIVSMLEQNEHLTDEECIVLSRLSVMEHPLIRAACSAYLKNQDEEDLAETMIKISKHLSLTKILDDLLETESIVDSEYQQLQTLFLEGEPALLQAWCSFVLAPEAEESLGEVVGVIMELLHAEKVPKLNLLNLLGEKEMLTNEETEVLVGLLEEGDERVLGAFEVYKLEDDLEDLCDTLIRIASRCINVEEEEFQDSVTANLSEATLHESEEGDNDNEEEKQELQELILALKTDSVINPEQFDLLSSYIDSDNELVMAAYDAYTVTDDVPDLIDTLKRIASMQPKNADKLNNENPEKKESEETADEESAEQVVEDCLNHMYAMVEEGSLSYDEAKHVSDLLLDGEEREDRVLAAFDVYRDLKNRSDFADTLKRICKITNMVVNESTISEQASEETMHEEEADDDDDDDEDDVNEEDLEQVYVEDDGEMRKISVINEDDEVDLIDR